MFEQLPRWLGALFHNVRAGHAKLVIVDPALALADATIMVTSPAFVNGGPLPVRFTADGDGASPPLTWGAVPPATAAIAIVVQDPDAPFPDPVLHALLWGLPADLTRLDENAILGQGYADRAPGDVGHHGAIVKGWAPPDPPPGHGIHDYVFQLFALDAVPTIGVDPGRAEIGAALQGHVLAAGMLVGTYARGEIAGGAATNAAGAAVSA